MAYFTKVEFSIKDVKRPSPPKRRSQRRAKQSSKRKVVTMQEAFTGHSDIAGKENIAHLVEESVQQVIFNSDDRIRAASPFRKNIHIDHHVKTIHRINPADKVRQRTLQPEMYFSIKPPDLDRLRTEQELIISNFRMQHPPVYDDSYLVPRLPELKREDCHHLLTSQRFTPRDRTLPKTTGTVLNDSLPFHPKLKEEADHGIHAKRWCVMTVVRDDPDRLLPITTRPTTRHEDFERVFKGKNKVLEEPRVIKFREEDLV